MQVFFLSGLGADNSVFRFLDLHYCEPVFIDWIPPENKPSLQEYALQLKERFIPDGAIVVGLSFGGMLATEMAKYHSSIRAILISSAKTSAELPSIYRMGKYFPLHEWVPFPLQKWFMLHMKWLFGIKSNNVKQVYEEIIRNSNPRFNRWAVNAILEWENNQVPQNLFHIHGTADKILPFKSIQCHYAVPYGSHLMVMEQPSIISELLKNVVTDQPVKTSIISDTA